jgi:hypothetical protein
VSTYLAALVLEQEQFETLKNADRNMRSAETHISVLAVSRETASG